MSYSHYSSSSRRSGANPMRFPDDAEFQAAKMEAMMGAPVGGTGGGNRSYSYRTSSSSAVPTSPLGSNLSMDAEMRRMEREMNNPLNSGNNAGTISNSYTTRSSSGGMSSPTSISIQQDPSSGKTVKKVVTTTTTKTNPHAVRELERLEQDFSRIGKTPDNYHDDFDKIKREISTGDAYREALSSSSHEQLRTKPSFDSGSQRETRTTTTRTYGSSGGSPIRADSSEVFIPIRTYDNTFDDFHMNRFLDHRDHFGSMGSSDLDAQRADWEDRLRGVKTDMFKFSPHTEFQNASIESSRAVAKNPLGNPEFSIQFDMRDFKADDINLSTKHGKLIISATHEDKIGKSTSRREFTRSVDLPADIQISMMRSVFSKDGVLSITAPIKPPHYDPMPIHPSISPETSLQAFDTPYTSHEPLSSSYRRHEPVQVYTAANTKSAPHYGSQVSPKYASRQNSNTAEDAHKPMDYTVPVSGYLPEEIVVSIEGHKVKVHGKHVENRIGGRKTHNEFTKMFDLPSDVDARDVRCYIREGHTLHVIAHVGEDIQGLVHFIAVNKRN